MFQRNLRLRVFSEVILAIFIFLAGTYAARRVVAQDPPTPAYRLQLGDEVQVEVLDLKDLATTATIRPDGRISVMLLDDIQAAGRTVPELRQDLTEGYAKLYRNPRVGVFVKSFSNRVVYVTGEVAKPGSVPLGASMTVVQAATMAGGFLPSSKLEEAVLLRQTDGTNRKVIPLEVAKILRGEAPDVALQPSDVVYVPKSDIKVFVGGEVQKPGLIPLDRELSALKAITAAGGLLDTGTARGALLLRDHGNTKPDIIPLHLDEVMRGTAQDTILKPYDIVFVPKSTISKVDKAIDQYIRRVIPMTLTGGFIYILGGGALASSTLPCFQ